MNMFVVGVDGGGTHTRVMVADDAGHVLGSADGAGSAVRPGAAAPSAEVIAAVVHDAIAKAGVQPTRARVLCAGVAGVGREPEREALSQALVALELADEVVVSSDALIGLEDAFGTGPGVLVTAGTGSIAWGRGPTGATARCGGWGPVCGDEGSGVWIGRRALSVVTAAYDGREMETALTGAVLTATECADVSELVPWAAHAAPAELAALARVVLQVAQGGDLRANSLVSLAVEELVLHARTLARQLFVDERVAIPMALGGGLMARGSLLRKRMYARLKTALPGAALRDDEVVPVRGAVAAALRVCRASNTT
jgi:glucosamine kinase